MPIALLDFDLDAAVEAAVDYIVHLVQGMWLKSQAEGAELVEHALQLGGPMAETLAEHFRQRDQRQLDNCMYQSFLHGRTEEEAQRLITIKRRLRTLADQYGVPLVQEKDLQLVARERGRIVDPAVGL
jgi:hypothetical protein